MDFPIIAVAGTDRPLRNYYLVAVESCTGAVTIKITDTTETGAPLAIVRAPDFASANRMIIYQTAAMGRTGTMQVLPGGKISQAID